MKKFLFSLIGATLCLPAGAASIEVKEYLGYMWKAVDTVDFGTVASGASTTYYKNNKPLQIVADGVDVASINIVCSDDNMSALVEGDDNYLYLAIAPENVGEYVSSFTLVADGVDSVEIVVKATVESLSYETISELKANSLKDGQRYYYTGSAVVSHVENGVIWVNDETGGAQISCQNASDFMPGDVVSFSGVAMSASQPWRSYLQGEVTLAEYFNWQMPTPKTVSGELTDSDYYCNVRLPKVRFTKQVTTEAYGTTYNMYYFEDEDGNTYMARSYSVDGEYAQYEDFEKKVDYDISGIVWAYSKDSMTAPSPTINMTVVRTTEPPVSLPVGDWKANAEVVIWQGQTMEMDLEVAAVENDPYTYLFKKFIYDWNGGDCTVYGTVSPDGKRIDFYTGQQLDGISTAAQDKFFGAYESYYVWEDDPTQAPFRKGTVIYGDLEEDGKSFQIDYFIANMQHNLYAIESNPQVEWGTTGAYMDCAKYFYAGVNTGITEIASDGAVKANPEYFDICGRRISSPVKGNIYIVRTGSKVEKIVY